MNTQKHVFYGAEGRYVAEVDFDRVTVERDALQQLLNARDEEVGKLRRTLITIRNHTGVSGNQIDMIDAAMENQA